MKCPFCRTNKTEVYNSRPTKFGSQNWRRRRCRTCQQVFTTYETADLSFLTVMKASGDKQTYSRAQLYADLGQALISKPDTIEALTDTIEAKLLDLQKRTLTTAEIVDIVLSTLKHFDTAAFVRYLANQTDLASNAQLKQTLKKY